MRNKKVIALVVLSVLAVISIARGIMAPAKHKKAIAAGSAVAAADKNKTHPDAIMERRAKRTSFKAWKRSPFARAGSSSSSSLALNGIIWNKDRPKAMIGDVIVAKGDTVEGNKVVEIKPKSVILSDGVKTFELNMDK